ncbi:MAG TPA: 30S ribosomal protein S1 [Thermoanaerobaculia bacterium]|jgi:small subunit ribosomal protein S1|nr:30S ribosomal protein S1 [Thermoanaerobaculia bacterium]
MEQDNQQNQDFGTILADFEQEGGEATPSEGPKVGDKVSGRIVSIGEAAAFVDLGGKAEGSIELSQIRNDQGELTANVGDTIEVLIASVEPETGNLQLKIKPLGKGAAALAELRQAFVHQVPVEGYVKATNKGGVEVQVSGLRAFCPVSQLDVRYVENPEQFVGQRLQFKISRLEEKDKGRPNIILSRRALLQEEEQSRAAVAREKLAIGAVLDGTVTSLTTYGAFVDLGGIEGLLHVSEISHTRVNDPKEVLSVGQPVQVQVTKIEKGKDGKGERISLSRRSLERDPWQDAAARFPEGSKVQGKVVRLETFGAFVELTPGLDGLVHISQLGAGRRVTHPREVVKPGQEVEVTVIGIDPVKKRISLSMAADADSAASQETVDAYVKESSSASSGFGTMADFFKVAKKGR